MATAVFGGGCFWCTEALFSALRGVTDVESGYAGGGLDAPTYEAVCSGRSGHAEVVRVHFDPDEIAYEELLRLHFATHDPTTLNRQGADRGTQYRSAIFTQGDAQREAAQRVAAEVAPLFDQPLTTQIAPLERFWPAEAYHQEYYARNAEQPYCQAVISPKLAKLRQRYADRLKTEI